MISQKMIEITSKNSVIRAMFEEGNRLAQLHGRENVYDFSLGNPSIPPPEAVNKVIGRLIETEDALSLHGYMSNAGYPQVRLAVAESLNKRFGTSFDENNIIMSSGAAGGMNVILKTLINPGDEVVVISPFFVEYANYVGNYDGIIKVAPARQSDFLPDLQALRDALSDKTKAVILNSPNNPTGVIYPEQTIKDIAAVLEEASQRSGAPIYIISDEPYRELAYDGAEVPFITKYYKNTIVGYSWSKSLSLPGQRIGYIVIPSEIDDYALIFEAAGIATRILGYVNAPSLMQKVAAECIDEQVDIDAYNANRRLLYDSLTKMGFDITCPQGAFYLWLKAPGESGAPGESVAPGESGAPGDDKAFIEAAKKYNILLVPGSAFMCPGYVRIAYCVAKSTIERSLPAFEKLAAEVL